MDEFGRVYNREAMTYLLKQSCYLFGLVQREEIYYYKFRNLSLFSCPSTYQFRSKLKDLLNSFCPTIWSNYPPTPVVAIKVVVALL